MKIYTHWVFNEEDQLSKHFFATKAEEESSTKFSICHGHKVVARYDWNVEPTAKGVAAFCTEQMHLKDYIEEPAENEPEENPLGELL